LNYNNNDNESSDDDNDKSLDNDGLSNNITNKYNLETKLIHEITRSFHPTLCREVPHKTPIHHQ